MIYLDCASTTKVDKEVIEAMLPFFDVHYENGSSTHRGGRLVSRMIDQARASCANLINAYKEEIIFTSGSTEAINLALKGFVEENFDMGNHIITCKTEHKAVLNTCKYLESKGVEVTYLDVDSTGLIDLKQLENSIKDTTCLIAIMFINNETGVLQNINEIGKIAKKNDVKFFTDATQAIGKLEIDVMELGIDMLSMSAHKINGPKGIGFLYKRKDVKLTPLIHGGAQEDNLRAGTYNSPLIAGLGKSCELASLNFQKNIAAINALNAHFKKIITNTAGIEIIGNQNSKTQNIFNLRVPGVDAQIFIEKSEDFEVSNGSACTAGIIEGSHVLKAMGYSEKECAQCLRISFDHNSTEEELNFFIDQVSK